MGMYTAFHIGIELKRGVSEDILRILRFMLKKESRLVKIENLLDHPLFETDRWEHMLISDSYYFTYKTEANLIEDSLTKTVLLSVTSNFKNYDNEIDKFMDWIRPYINAKEGDWLGYWMYENDTIPTNIFY